MSYFQNPAIRYAADIMSKCTDATSWTEQRTALFQKSTGKLVGIVPVSAPYAGVVQLEKQFELEARVIDVTISYAPGTTDILEDMDKDVE